MQMPPVAWTLVWVEEKCRIVYNPAQETARCPTRFLILPTSPHLQRILDALQAEIAEREQATADLARQNAELHGELQRRLAESESFNRVLVSLLQKTVLEQVLDIVCAEAQGLIGATGSAVLLLTDQAWLEVKHRLGKPLAALVVLAHLRAWLSCTAGFHARVRRP